MTKPSDFHKYFSAVHGCSPFPWQRRLLNDVVENGRWPSSINLPPGTGKTAILDVALYAMGCGAHTPRRTVLVVDRRVVVDEAYRRAGRIRNALCADAGKGDPVLASLRKALLELGGESPLEIALLRGGMYREDTWARHPAQPLLVCSTVDQTGSRILHRGYGVSPSMRPIHAGLLSNDCLIVLDEAHCSEPFRQTLEWIEKYRGLGDSQVETPFAFVTMSATPRGSGPVFTLNGDDRKDQNLSKRLKAKKRLHLEVAIKAKSEGLAAECASRARELARGKGKTILIVVNRVATARMIAEELAESARAAKNKLSVDGPILLTGRSRPLERDTLLERWANRLYSDSRKIRGSFSESPSLVVVATQCVEVGADIDADALICEACPLDSLRQRLGRLDRLGELGDSDAYIIAPKELADATKDKPFNDPIYGESTVQTWKWLKRLGKECPPDKGIANLEKRIEELDPAEKEKLQPPLVDAPTVFPVYCDLWAQTNPEPAQIPEPAIFLHGARRGQPEVQIIWRADLPISKPETWAAIMSACPPVAGEALQVPLFQARQWLSAENSDAQSGSDIEGELSQEQTKTKNSRQGSSPFLIWRGNSTTDPINDPWQIGPGDSIVVPASIGGCDSWGWAPERKNEVADLADLARYKSGRAPIIRINSSYKEPWPETLRMLPFEQSDETVEAIKDEILEALQAADPSTAVDEAHRMAVLAARSGAGFSVDAHPSGDGWIITCRMSLASIVANTLPEDDSASESSRPVILEDHLRDVASKVESFAHCLHFPDAVKADMIVAANLHDLGKSDPRFQSLLWGGDRIASLQGKPLAKSDRMRTSKVPYEVALEKSGYPRGGRHELLSLRLAESQPEIQESATDWDLVLHLIACHHGRCRPFAPVVEDPAPRPVKAEYGKKTLCASSDCVRDGIGLGDVSSGITNRFWTLVRRYGWWGLSYLEACFRLADHRASEDEQTGGLP